MPNINISLHSSIARQDSSSIHTPLNMNFISLYPPSLHSSQSYGSIHCYRMGLMIQSGKPQFSYIYGVGLLGTTAIYLLLNLMSPSGIDAYRTASVLGYCLLPMVGLGSIGIAVGTDHIVGYVLAVLSIVWCTHSASGIFTAVLRMDRQRLLVAYPVGLFYACFSLLSIFKASGTV